MMGGFRARVALGVAAVLVGCNALTGAADLEADRGEGALDPRRLEDVDAASSRNDGSPTTSPPEGDGSTVPVGDAGTDAPLAVDGDAGPPLGFCASLSPAPTLCTDFDDGVFPAPWTIGQLGTSTTTSTNAASRSPTRSLLLDVPGGASGAAFLEKAFPAAAATKVSVSFSVLLVSRDQARDLELGTILLGLSGGNRYEAQLELIAGNELNIEEETPASDGTVPQRDVALGVTLPTGVWKRITWSISFAAGSSSLAVALEGAASPAPLAVQAHRYPSAPIVRIGDEAASTYQSQVRFDDIVVNVQ